MYVDAKLPLIVEYAEDTTFHGMKYIFRIKQSIFERLFWTFILTTLISVLGYFVYSNVSRFIQFPLQIQENAQSTHVFEIPFPAVTICPANKIQNLDVQNIMNNFEKFENKSQNDLWDSVFGSMLLMATQVCRKSFSDTLTKMIIILSENNISKITFPSELNEVMVTVLNQMSPNLEESIRECQIANWYDKDLAELSKTNIKNLFYEIITNDGVCFTFNIIPDVLRPKYKRHLLVSKTDSFIRNGWDPETGYSIHKAYPFKGIVWGNEGQNGFGVRLSANLSQRIEICLPSNLGYKLLLHSPSEYPHTYEKFITLEYGKEYTIAVKPETISTADTLRSISPEIRQCFFNDERQLKYYTFYNENNCKLECYANYSLKMLGGFPFSAPRDRNTPISRLKLHNYGWYLPNYFGSIHAYNEIYKNSVSLNLSLDTDCNCLPDCNLIRYDYEIIGISVNMTEAQEIEKFINVSETWLEIVFRQPTFIGKERVEEYTFSSLVSDFGGLLGLFMGGSIISIFELIYFFVIRNFCTDY